MNTLIINGSPRQNGDTAALLDAFLSGYRGEYRVLSEKDGIAPCCDCRYCFTHPGCARADAMQEIYTQLESYDNIVIASPVWYSSLSGITLNLCSRFQTFFAGKRFRRDIRTMKPRRGVVLLTGGQRGTETAPVESASVILRLLGVSTENITVVTSMDTDRISAKDDAAALYAAQAAGTAHSQKVDKIPI